MPYDRFYTDPKPVAEGGGGYARFYTEPEPDEPPKRKVGALQAFGRDVGRTYANAGQFAAVLGGGALSLVDMAANTLMGRLWNGEEFEYGLRDAAFKAADVAGESADSYQDAPGEERGVRRQD